LVLPSYKEQDAEVWARFQRLYQRPVVLSVRSLCKTFDTAQGAVEALRDVSFDVHRREFVCVLGESGCGKSTLIRLLAGLEGPTSGLVALDGKEVTGPGPDRGMVFQSYTLFPWLTVQRNVMFGLRRKGVPRSRAAAEAKKWVDLVGLSQFQGAYPYQLSGGMKQRVAIARALANQPRVLLMDEPFGALDAQTRAQMQSHLKQIWMNVDVTIVFITHDLDEAVYLADRIILLSSRPGRIAEIIEVPMPQPRPAGLQCSMTPDMQVDPRFLATRLRLDELLHPRTDHAAEPLPIQRLTREGDDVL
jgi:NitT/TauT family transport system ATP-binding protein